MDEECAVKITYIAVASVIADVILDTITLLTGIWIPLTPFNVQVSLGFFAVVGGILFMIFYFGSRYLYEKKAREVEVK